MPFCGDTSIWHNNHCVRHHPGYRPIGRTPVTKYSVSPKQEMDTPLLINQRNALSSGLLYFASHKGHILKLAVIYTVSMGDGLVVTIEA